MKKALLILLITLTSVLSPLSMVAQTTAGAQITLNIQDYCLMDTNGAPVNLTLNSSVAGAPITSVTNSDMYVRVSSITPGGTYRKVTARVSSGTIPAGTRLTLVAALSTNTNGAGRIGVVSPMMILSSVDQTLIHGIGSYYTGTGLTDGYRLTYTWGTYNPTTDYHLLNATVVPATLTIMLTISAPDGNNI